MTPYVSDRFVAFTALHYLLLALFAVGAVLIARWGRAHRDRPEELAARRRFAAALAVVAVGMQAYMFTPRDFDLKTSLPLALCDVATVTAVVALWTRGPRATAFTYYVGLTLTSQAIVTPSLTYLFPHPRFFGFWALHFGVVWAAVYLVWGLGIRPTWRLYWFAVAATATWAVAVYAFNLAAGTNYGYVNAKPGSASLLDLFGPWPVYLAVAAAIVLTAWAVLLTWPWQLAARRRPASVPSAQQ